MLKRHLGTIFAAAFGALIVAAIGPATAAFWQWSKVTSTNASIDPTINWAEGMSPSSVNDSARAMMARAAEYRDDISGALVTAGTATAYTVTTNQGLTAVPTDGQMIAFTPNVTNGIAPTMTADAGTTYPIQTSPGVAVTPATLISGTPYTAKFSLSNAAWILRDFYAQPYSVPLGASIIFSGSVSPNSNFVFPEGQCISRTTYAAYFTMVSTTYGACDGTTTFGVPDYRARVVAGYDSSNATGRMTGTFTGGVSAAVMGNGGGEQAHILLAGEIPALSSSGLSASSISNSSVSGGVYGGTGQSTLSISGGGNPAVVGSAAIAISTATSTSIGGVINSTGGAANNNIQPTIVQRYILRIS